MSIGEQRLHNQPQKDQSKKRVKIKKIIDISIKSDVNKLKMIQAMIETSWIRICSCNLLRMRIYSLDLPWIRIHSYNTPWIRLHWFCNPL